jgi:hypothetical protein
MSEEGSDEVFFGLVTLLLVPRYPGEDFRKYPKRGITTFILMKKIVFIQRKQAGFATFNLWTASK